MAVHHQVGKEQPALATGQEPIHPLAVALEVRSVSTNPYNDVGDWQRERDHIPGVDVAEVAEIRGLSVNQVLGLTTEAEPASGAPAAGTDAEPTSASPRPTFNGDGGSEATRGEAAAVPASDEEPEPEGSEQ